MAVRWGIRCVGPLRIQAVSVSTSGHGKATVGFMQDVGTLLSSRAWRKGTAQVCSVGAVTVVPSQGDEDRAHCGVGSVG